MAKLIYLEGPKDEKLKSGTSIPLGRAVLLIGRDPTQALAGDALKLESGTVSKNHASILWKKKESGGDYIVRDNGSTNGSFINGAPVTVGVERVLQHNDTLVFGEYRFLVDLLGSVESGMQSIDAPLVRGGHKYRGEISLQDVRMVVADQNEKVGMPEAAKQAVAAAGWSWNKPVGEWAARVAWCALGLLGGLLGGIWIAEKEMPQVGWLSESSVVQRLHEGTAKHRTATRKAEENARATGQKLAQAESKIKALADERDALVNAKKQAEEKAATESSGKSAIQAEIDSLRKQVAQLAEEKKALVEKENDKPKTDEKNLLEKLAEKAVLQHGLNMTVIKNGVASFESGGAMQVKAGTTTTVWSLKKGGEQVVINIAGKKATMPAECLNLVESLTEAVKLREAAMTPEGLAARAAQEKEVAEKLEKERKRKVWETEKVRINMLVEALSGDGIYLKGRSKDTPGGWLTGFGQKVLAGEEWAGYVWRMEVVEKRGSRRHYTADFEEYVRWREQDNNP